MIFHNIYYAILFYEYRRDFSPPPSCTFSKVPHVDTLGERVEKTNFNRHIKRIYKHMLWVPEIPIA